jgi:hypothetical protein
VNEYHKIPSVFKRDPQTKYRTLLEGVYATPELEYLRNSEWRFTEKVDGTNIRVMWQPGPPLCFQRDKTCIYYSDDGTIRFGGRTDKAQTPDFLLRRLREIFDGKEDVFESVFDCPVCLYGEGYGPKIQKGGGNYGDTQSFVLFDIKIGDCWLKWDDVIDIGEKLSLQVVPTVSIGRLQEMIYAVRSGIRSKWGNFQSEGLVARPMVPLLTRTGRRIITKLKTCDFR